MNYKRKRYQPNLLWHHHNLSFDSSQEMKENSNKLHEDSTQDYYDKIQGMQK